MTISDEKVRVVAYVDKNLIEAIDKIAGEMGISRSSAVEACIESGLDDLKLLGFVGLTPRRLRAVGEALVKLKRFKSGWVDIDFKSAVGKLSLD